MVATQDRKSHLLHCYDYDINSLFLSTGLSRGTLALELAGGDTGAILIFVRMK